MSCVNNFIKKKFAKPSSENVGIHDTKARVLWKHRSLPTWKEHKRVPSKRHIRESTTWEMSADAGDDDCVFWG